LVDAHPQIAITPETHWIPRFYRERIGLSAEGEVTPALLDSLIEYRTYAKLGIGRRALEQLLKPEAGLSYAHFVSRLFDLYGSAQGKLLVGDKTPGYCRHIRLLHSLWPAVQFVHLIRDGRDVCLSALHWERKLPKLRTEFPTWDEDPVSTCALWWKWHVRLGQQAQAALPPGQYLELRYEDLIARPAKECRSLCAFLGVPPDDRMLRFHEGRTSRKPGLDAKKAWLPITSGLRDWRTQMDAEEVERFEAAAGDLLTELNYPRASVQLSGERQQHAARIHARFPKDSYFQVASSPAGGD
jgi:hypothetical protein